MSSVELVGIINSMREEGKPELRHDHFMVKLEKHPGIDSPKFLGQYKDATGRTLKCYNLPKRECELMVMSESLVVQAKVYDRMVELEVIAMNQEVAQPAVAMHPAKEAVFAIGDFYKHLTECGISDINAFSLAVDAAHRITGVSMMSPAPVMPQKPVEHRQEQLPLPLTSVQSNKKLYYVYELANMFGRSIAGTNCLLTRRKYQERKPNGRYVLLEAGKKFGLAGVDDGELLWSKDVLAAR